jgi:hypothetical protein
MCTLQTDKPTETSFPKPSAAMECIFDVQQNMQHIALDALNRAFRVCNFNAYKNHTLKTHIENACHPAFSTVYTALRCTELISRLFCCTSKIHLIGTNGSLHIQNASLIDP